MSARARPASGGGVLSAYVLHQYDWSESSLIVELFTRERGRVAVAAKGAKRPTSQLRPILLPFSRLVVQLAKAPADAELHTLRAAEWAGGEPTVAGAALFAGFHLNELLLKLLPRQDPHARLFDAYAAVLRMLGAGDESARRAALRAFEWLLLRELGWLPALGAVTPTGRPIEPGQGYTLHAEHGIVGASGGFDGATLAAIDVALATDDLVGLRDACLPAASALRDALAAVLHYHLGHASLRTRQVMHGVHQLQRVRAATREDPR